MLTALLLVIIGFSVFAAATVMVLLTVLWLLEWFLDDGEEW